MRTYTAVAKPPIYTIIEVGEVKTKAERNAVNDELEKAGSNFRVSFKFSGGVMEYDAGPGYPYLYEGGRYRSLLSKYLVIHPNGQVAQTDNLDGFKVTFDNDTCQCGHKKAVHWHLEGCANCDCAQHEYRRGIDY